MDLLKPELPSACVSTRARALVRTGVALAAVLVVLLPWVGNRSAPAAEIPPAAAELLQFVDPDADLFIIADKAAFLTQSPALAQTVENLKGMIFQVPQVSQALQALQGQTGIDIKADILENIGGERVIAVKFPEKGEEEAPDAVKLLVVAPVKDPARAEKLFATVRAIISAQANFTFYTYKYGNTNIYYAYPPKGDGKGYAMIAMAVWDKYLVAGTSVAWVAEAISRKSGTQGLSITSDRKCMEALGLLKYKPAAAVVIRVPRLMKAMSFIMGKVMAEAMRAAPGGKGGIQIQPFTMMPFMTGPSLDFQEIEVIGLSVDDGGITMESVAIPTEAGKLLASKPGAAQPLDFDIFSTLPSGPVAFFAGSSPAAGYDAMMKTLDELEKGQGDTAAAAKNMKQMFSSLFVFARAAGVDVESDVLSWMTGSVAGGLYPMPIDPDKGPDRVPAFFLFQTDKPAAALGFVQKVRGLIKGLSQGQVDFVEGSIGTAKVFTIPIPPEAKAPVSPAIAVSDKLVIISLDKELLGTILQGGGPTKMASDALVRSIPHDAAFAMAIDPKQIQVMLKPVLAKEAGKPEVQMVNQVFAMLGPFTCHSVSASSGIDTSLCRVNLDFKQLGPFLTKLLGMALAQAGGPQ